MADIVSDGISVVARVPRGGVAEDLELPPSKMGFMLIFDPRPPPAPCSSRTYPRIGPSAVWAAAPSAVHAQNNTDGQRTYPSSSYRAACDVDVVAAPCMNSNWSEGFG